jgi:hypothetical protein
VSNNHWDALHWETGKWGAGSGAPCCAASCVCARAAATETTGIPGRGNSNRTFLCMCGVVRARLTTIPPPYAGAARSIAVVRRGATHGPTHSLCSQRAGPRRSVVAR